VRAAQTQRAAAMLTILASGTLVSDPRERTTAAGKPYCTTSLRIPCEDGEPVLISAIAFNADAVQALLALTKGDAVAIAGRAKFTSWEKDGEGKHGLSVVADKVLTVYQIEKRRKQARDAEGAPA
jgi:single-strand DNA-binding protein